jgi:lipoprotein-anchoring transpeptidase ErfK/SrfK
MRGQEASKLFLARGTLAALVVVLVALLAPAAPAAVSKLPAAGQLAWPSVAVRKAPSPTAKRKMTLFELRSDLRPQIVLAVGKRLVGYQAPARATATLNAASTGQPVLALVARDEGVGGNALQVRIAESGSAPDTEDEIVIVQGGSELMRFAFLQDLSNLEARLQEYGAPVRVARVLAPGVPLAHATVPLAGGRDGKAGRVWYKLNLPIRPFGQTGWVPEGSVDVRPTKRRVVVHRNARYLEVFEGARRIFKARVAVGRPDRKTPLGSFYVAAKYRPPTNALVSGYALELSAPAGLPDFLKGGVVGIHGTPATWSIGKSASNGCVRVTNSTVFRLKKIVPLGTPVRVVR